MHTYRTLLNYRSLDFIYTTELANTWDWLDSIIVTRWQRTRQLLEPLERTRGPDVGHSAATVSSASSSWPLGPCRHRARGPKAPALDKTPHATPRPDSDPLKGVPPAFSLTIINHNLYLYIGIYKPNPPLWLLSRNYLIYIYIYTFFCFCFFLLSGD